MGGPAPASERVRRVFRLLVPLLVWGNVVTLFWAFYYPPEYFYPELERWIQVRFEEFYFSIGDWNWQVLRAFFYLFLALYMVSCFGLLRMYSWGRMLFTVCFLSGFLLEFAFPMPLVADPGFRVVIYVVALLEGGLLAIMWLPPLAGEFRGVRKEAL
ncbi:MAG: hypothetical protein AAGK14_14860 [Verrucomicrobiota bacterium]